MGDSKIMQVFKRSDYLFRYDSRQRLRQSAFLVEQRFQVAAIHVLDE